MATEGATPQLSPQSAQQVSRIAPTHTERRMRELLIYEQELDDVSMLNTLVTGFSSAASGTAFCVIGIVASALMQEKITDKVVGMLWVGVPAGLFLTLGFIVAAVLSWLRKGSRIATMKQAAVDLAQPSLQVIPTVPILSGDALPQPVPDTAGHQP